MKRILGVTAVVCLLCDPCQAGIFETVWQAGFDDESQNEFSHESEIDDDYYFAGTYGIGTVEADEPWHLMERALYGNGFGEGDSISRWHFNLDTSHVAEDTTLRVTFDLIWPGSDANTSSHDLRASFNGAVIGSLNGVSEAKNWQLSFAPGEVGAGTGENVLEIARTGGINGDSPSVYGWIQFDYVRLEAAAVPEPTLAATVVTVGLVVFGVARRRRARNGVKAAGQRTGSPHCYFNRLSPDRCNS